MPTSQDLSGLPDPATLKNFLRSAAILNTALDGEGQSYMYHPEWDQSVQVGIFNNGCGDDIHAVFVGNEVLLKGFDHESDFSPWARDDEQLRPGIYEGMPPALASELADVALSNDEATFAIWWTGGQWLTGPVAFEAGEDDGSEYLLGAISMTPSAFTAWIVENYEIEVDGDMVARVFQGEAITKEWITALNPERDIDDALAEIAKL